MIPRKKKKQDEPGFGRTTWGRFFPPQILDCRRVIEDGDIWALAEPRYRQKLLGINRYWDDEWIFTHLVHWIGLREKIAGKPQFHRKNHGFMMFHVDSPLNQSMTCEFQMNFSARNDAPAAATWWNFHRKGRLWLETKNHLILPVFNVNTPNNVSYLSIYPSIYLFLYLYLYLYIIIYYTVISFPIKNHDFWGCFKSFKRAHDRHVIVLASSMGGAPNVRPPLDSIQLVRL